MTLELVDFTKMRLGSKPDGRRKIAVCPKCGRKGQVNPFFDKGTDYYHVAKRSPFGLHVRDRCYIKREAE
jgi:hypothetical protein